MAATVCQILPQVTLHPAEVQVAGLVQAGITGCLTMAVGVCLTAQPAVAQPTRQLRLLQLLLNLRLLRQLQPQLKPALLLHPQANPHPNLRPVLSVKKLNSLTKPTKLY